MKIRILAAHTHDCTHHLAGAEIELDDWAAQWLIGIGKAENLAQERSEKTENRPGLQDPPLPPLPPVQVEIPGPARKRWKSKNIPNAG